MGWLLLLLLRVLYYEDIPSPKKRDMNIQGIISARTNCRAFLSFPFHYWLSNLILRSVGNKDELFQKHVGFIRRREFHRLFEM